MALNTVEHLHHHYYIQSNAIFTFYRSACKLATYYKSVPVFVPELWCSHHSLCGSYDGWKEKIKLGNKAALQYIYSTLTTESNQYLEYWEYCYYSYSYSSSSSYSSSITFLPHPIPTTDVCVHICMCACKHVCMYEYKISRKKVSPKKIPKIIPPPKKIPKKTFSKFLWK